MFLDPACFATEEGRDTWNRGSNSASTLEGLGEPLTQFHFRSSIRPVARKRPKRTVTRHTASRTNAQFWTPTGAVVRVPSLQLVLDAGLRPLHAARVPPLLLAVSWRGRRQPPAGGEEPSNQRPPAGEGCSQSKWGRRRERERGARMLLLCLTEIDFQATERPPDAPERSDGIHPGKNKPHVPVELQEGRYHRLTPSVEDVLIWWRRHHEGKVSQFFFFFFFLGLSQFNSPHATSEGM